MNWYKSLKQIIGFFFLVIVALSVLFVLQFGDAQAADNAHPTVAFASSDVAPVDGVLAVYVQYGVQNRPEGWLVDKWSILAGESVSRSIKVPSKQYARLWFRPTNSMNWYLLPSQYWHGGGSCGDEYGVSPRHDLPSYHIFFSRWISQDEVPLLTDIEACSSGSVPIDEPTPTIVPMPTLCAKIDDNQKSPCR